ncbi:uncharacterized protein LOC105013135 isoform X1 [Esox lucius]|uniref:uncharacterized protein LOC105013135 isoform X1 n=1 Tax=Esox lucius TaxID=8010 RepID=UPI0014776D8C|nr:uncharacterized protein LOC105013135 isoform X1 [Esox lucius]
MSATGQQLLFEGFLKKRKDTMKMKWATYWFRLHNTTLFFYTKKHGSASHLRGLYYIYTVQSVRVIQKESKHSLFEIIMKNGKRKVLAAETDDLRRVWIDQLWRAMHLSAPGGSFPGSIRQQNVGSDDLRIRGHTIAYNGSECNSVTENLEVHRPLSVPLSPCTPKQNLDLWKKSTFTLPTPLKLDQDLENWSTNSLSRLNRDLYLCDSGVMSLTDKLKSEESTEQNTISHWEECNDSVPKLTGNCDERDEEESHYDILPARNSEHQTKQSEENLIQQEGIYDFPLSNRRATDRRTEHQTDQSDEDLTHGVGIYDVPMSNRRASDQQECRETTESIYDVPRSLLKKMSDHTLESYPGGVLLEDSSLLDDTMASLAGRL